MWPFRSEPPPGDLTIDGVTVSFSRDTKQWEFIIRGIEFTVDGGEFDPAAIDWAKNAIPQLKSMEGSLAKAAKECLSEYSEEINLESARLLNVDLSEFDSDGYLIASYIGDETWGDMGVAITIKDGTIIAADAGD